MTKTVTVTFEPSGRTVKVPAGTKVAQAALQAGLEVNRPCGGAGTCGKCLVRIRSGHAEPTPTERKHLGDEKLAAGFRLSCESQASSALVVEIPDSSLLQTGQKILTHDSGESMAVQPRVRKTAVRLTPPSHGDAASDLDRLAAAIGPRIPTLTALQNLPGVLRRNQFAVTAVCAGNRLLDVEPGDTAARVFGAAFDIGSTTVVGTLIDLDSGKDLAVAARINPQTSFGDDVLTRIRKCREEADGLSQLRQAVLGAINAILAELASKAGTSPQSIYEAAFAGNSTMQQIFCGLDPAPLGELPFVPVFTTPQLLRAGDLGLAIHPEARVFIFPQIGGFVGGDTVSGIVATRLDRNVKPALLVDIGTNGEIALAKDGRLIATSVAAGPAFEGARIINGMRATAGAIEKVAIDTDVRIHVIGEGKASGLCGTGLIDAAAELLRHGILDSTGRIVDPDEAPAALPPAVKARILSMLGENHFILAKGEESVTGEPLLLYQKDIRELQLANGAIRAGISILLKQAGLVVEDLQSVLLAGAFGNYIRKENALRIGMLPQVSPDRIHFVGNAASFGAKRALLAEEEQVYAGEIIRKARHVDLSLDPDFMDEFSMAMMFPEG
jgi:uncharacterized 2Fe-2S/4Fe-4S cluster protein (DUF4445 family)